MALFVVTGILSLSAGLGIGALLPPHEHQHQQHPKKQVTVPHIKVASAHSQVPMRVPVPKKAAVPNDKILDFTDFDKSLLKLVENSKPAKPSPLQGGQTRNQSTLRKSVVENSEFYSPPTVVENLQGGGKPKHFETSWF